jgi:hypothetical protein
MYDIGDVVPLSINITDPTGVAANAGSVTVTITMPDNSALTSPPISPTIVGQYDYAYTAVQAGRHDVRWVATGANAGAYQDVFEVRATDSFISLTEMKDYLNIPLDKTTWDGELRDASSAACGIIEFLVGPVLRRQIIEYYDGGDGYTWKIMLQRVPIISIDEIVETWGTGISNTLVNVAMPDTTGSTIGYTYDAITGQVVRRSLGWPYPFPFGIKNVKFTYTVGRTSTPGNINTGAKELIGHIWRQSQLNSEGRRPRVARPEPVTVILGYAIPNRVLEMLQATPRTPTVG